MKKTAVLLYDSFCNFEISPALEILALAEKPIVKETIGVGVNEKTVLRFYQTALSFTSISIFPW